VSGVDGLELVCVFENLSKVILKAREFLFGQVQARQLGDVDDLVSADSHVDAIGEKSRRANHPRCGNHRAGSDRPSPASRVGGSSHTSTQSWRHGLTDFEANARRVASTRCLEIAMLADLA
jgi:hypothetical protein